MNKWDQYQLECTKFNQTMKEKKTIQFIYQFLRFLLGNHTDRTSTPMTCTEAVTENTIIQVNAIGLYKLKCNCMLSIIFRNIQRKCIRHHQSLNRVGLGRINHHHFSLRRQSSNKSTHQSNLLETREHTHDGQNSVIWLLLQPYTQLRPTPRISL